jgi:putative addiction module component (TIGR02574 family)
MTHIAEKFLSEALTLPAIERAEVAEQLLKSLDHSTQDDSNAELAWQQEIDKRFSELNSGKVTGIPWEDVRARIQGTVSGVR